MRELKIQQIDLAKASSAKKVSKNITDVLNFQVEMAQEINRVIAEFNKLLPRITAPSDDSTIKSTLAKLVDTTKSLVSDVDLLKQEERESYNDSELISEVQKIKEDNEKLKKTLSVNQAEFRSLRNITGSQLNDITQKIDTLTEIK